MNGLKGLVALVTGVVSITVMQMHALDHGINGTLYTLSVLTVGGLIAGFCGFKLKDVISWWRDRNGPS